MKLRDWGIGLIVFAGTLVLPLLGTALSGRSLAPLFEFPPPLLLLRGYSRFSWAAAGAVGLALVILLRPFLRQAGSGGTSRTSPIESEQVTRRPFPVWGWAAIGWTLFWWWIAWARPPQLAVADRYSFFPLWFGFIITVNAITTRRRGSCRLLRDPLGWVTLFAASAAFWWAFEWLNRFVLNWHYVGVADFGALEYAANATICFSTVLPAVTGVAECLEAYGWFDRWENGPVPSARLQRVTGWPLAIAAAVGLTGTGFFPLQFYPALWAGPLALAIGLGSGSGRPGFWMEVRNGDWRRPLSWAAAALICGFFWEMWNARSTPHWIYTVPYVDRWHVFEMPLLGYTGYLPFGLECLVVHDWLQARRRKAQSGIEPAVEAAHAAEARSAIH